MTRYWKRALSLASSLGALTLGVAQAHEPGAPETQRWTGAEEPYHLSEPHIERDRGVAYVSGGIGIERRGRIIELGGDMSLQLVFARMPDGVYLADVDVRIADERGNVLLDVVSAGPMLFAQLPAGTYRITARVDGRTIRHRVAIPAQGQHTEFFHWRERAAAA